MWEEASFYRVCLQKAGMMAKAFFLKSHVIQVLLIMELAQYLLFVFWVLVTQSPAPFGTAECLANTL